MLPPFRFLNWRAPLLFTPGGPPSVKPAVSIVIALAGIGSATVLMAKSPVSVIVELASGLALAALIAARSSASVPAVKSPARTEDEANAATLTVRRSLPAPKPFEPARIKSPVASAVDDSSSV